MPKPPVKADSRRATRPYKSPKREQRAQETRRRIRDAASRLFLRDGYAATTMTAIARAAKVGERTVYLAFPTKPALLGEIITVAVRGGDDDAPLAAPVLEVAEAAAASNPELAAQRERGQRNMRSDYRAVGDALARSGVLADTVTSEYAADTIYALAGHDVYLRLTRECGWTGARYAAWLGDTLSAALTRSARRR